ncbi:uncharacterized protein LOC143009173 [Genypterus blacodes]|uniref:uncharacterized protein LOC143009173 n=1 Tax=Genypterus blacodes TaxID=154954 RepID=UPI003F7582C2
MPLIWLILVLSANLDECVPVKPKRSPLNQLTRALLRKYDRGVRPVHNWTSPTTIYIDLILQSILNVIWTDEFLVWDPEDYDGINEISLTSDAIWIPDVIVSEFVDEGKSPPIPYVYVNSTGSVKNYRPIQAVLACSLEMYAFPFDKQNCTMTFRSWLHSVKEIDLALWRNAEAISNDKREFINDGEWELLSIPSHYWQIRQGDTDYAQVQFHVLIRRRPLVYVVGLLIPSIFLMLVDVISFYLPLNSGTRITFKISILLGYTVFRVNLMDELPVSAVKTPLIGVFFVVCMALLMLSLVKSILVVKLLHHSEKEVRQMSVSACLLDENGSVDYNFTDEGTFTSIKTLNHINHPADYDCGISLEEDLLSINGTHDAPSGLELILQELISLHLYLSQEDSESFAQAEWLALCSKVDRFLFWVYLFVLGLYAGTMLLLWNIGYKPILEIYISDYCLYLYFSVSVECVVKKPSSSAGRFANATLVRLSEFLSTGYKKGVRPVKDWRKSTTVAIDLMVYSILNVDEKNQVLTTYVWYRQLWTDEFLVWNPDDFDEVQQVSIPTANVWVPDILINEFVDVGKSPDIPYVYVTHSGLVRNYKPIQVVTACTLNIYNFPFDVQNCSLTFQSWLHTINDINITLMRNPEELKEDKSVFMNQGEWELLHVLSDYKSFSLDDDDHYAEMKFHVVIRRRPLFYTVNLLLPSIFLMVMDIVGFYLPPDSGERVSFKVTLLLGYSVFLIIVSDTLPATAIGTPLIGVYFVVCMALLVISLTETVLIVRLVHKQDMQPPVPHWVKYLVLERAPILFCIHKKHRLCPRLSSQASDIEHYRDNNYAAGKNSCLRVQVGKNTQCSHHHTCEMGRRLSHDGQGRLFRLGVPTSREPTTPIMDNILQEVTSIRHFLEKRDRCRDVAKEWLQVGYVLDVLLFRVYLLAMVAYSITLGTLWSVWQVA